MSIHPSLSSSLKNRKQRSVLTRIERIKYLQEKGLFTEQTSVFGLPKIKSVKIKIKKEKAAEKTAATAGEAQAPAAADAKGAAKGAKAAPSAKPAK